MKNLLIVQKANLLIKKSCSQKKLQPFCLILATVKKKN